MDNHKTFKDYLIMTKGSLSLLFVFSFFINAHAQEVRGTVTDASTGEAIIGANILVEETGSGTITDFDGNYQLSLNPGTYRIVISYLGYEEVGRQVVMKDEDVELNIAMGADQLSLDEVVVTGTFSTRSQKESPISMTYLGSAQLQRLSANSQADILRTIPGITAEGGGGEVASNVFVRGMPSGGQYQFTPLQVDGMPVLSTFGLNSSAHDVYFRNDIGIRNLEFVRGGASTLFGAGSVAGIINYSSVTGTAKQVNKVNLEWADKGRAKIDFLSSGPLAENLYYAVSGFYRYDEGPIQTGLPTKGSQVRANIKKLFNDGKSSLTVSTQFIDDKVQFFLPYPLANDNGDFTRPIGNDGEEVFTLQTGAVRDFGFVTPDGRFESPIADGASTKGGYFMMDLKHSFGNDLKLSGKVKYAQYDHWFNLFLDGDGRPAGENGNLPQTQADYMSTWGLPSDAQFTYIDNGQALASGDRVFRNRVLDRERPMEEIVGEFNLTKTIVSGAATHDLTIGTFVSNTSAEDNNWIWNYLGDFRDQPRLVGVTYTDENGDAAVHSNGGFISGSKIGNNFFESTKAAVYFADQIKGERWNFDLGVRYEYAKGTIVKESGVGTNRFNRGTVDASDFAVALAALYKVSDEVNVYANASRGYFFPELRGVKFVNGQLGVTQSYEPETVYQGELGLKYGSKKLSGTAALFLVSLQDRRSVDLVNGPNGTVLETALLQSTRTIGLEANANYSVSRALNINLGLTVQDHEFTEFEGSPELEGNWLRRQPKIMYLAGLNYDKNGWDFGASYNYFGKKYANDGNTVELEGFDITRLDAGHTFRVGDGDETLRLGFSIFNLFDSEGITEGSPRQGNAQTGAAEFFVGRPILPRRVFIRAQFTF